METLDHRRRKSAASGELEAAGQFSDTNAALSQAQPAQSEAGGVLVAGREAPPKVVMNPLEASPGMMEQGYGVVAPIASPFHSEKVRSELELRRRRTLSTRADDHREPT